MKVIATMRVGSVPVIGYLLSRPRRGVSAPHRLRSDGRSGERERERALSSEERALLQCTGTPQLAARKVTERLVRDRYKLRIEKKQTVEDSLLEC